MEKILFIIYQDEIRFVPNRSMSCKDYYLSLGGKIEDYDDLIRGMISDGKVIFMKSNLKYDSEVVNIARRCAPAIRQQLNMPHLITCCGIIRGVKGEPWKPSLVLQEDDGIISDEQQELLVRANTMEDSREGELFDFRNDYQDEKFIKYACRFVLYLILATLIVKGVLFYQNKIDMSIRWIALIVALQFVLLFITFFGYKKQWKKTKYFGLLASAALVALMDLPDIIIGVINLLFTVDQKYIVKILDFFHRVFHRREKKKV